MTNKETELKKKQKEEIGEKQFLLRTRATCFSRYYKVFKSIEQKEECSKMLRNYSNASKYSVRMYNQIISDSELSESEKTELYINEELFI